MPPWPNRCSGFRCSSALMKVRAECERKGGRMICWWEMRLKTVYFELEREENKNFDCVSREGNNAHHNLISQHAERPKVTAMIVASMAYNFRCLNKHQDKKGIRNHVFRSPHITKRPLSWMQNSTHSEVGEDEMTIIRHEDVFHLQITICDL